MSNFDEILNQELQKEAEGYRNHARRQTTADLVKAIGTGIQAQMDIRQVSAYKYVLKERGVKGIPA